MKIGWIGLGNMGSPMALQLIKFGHEVQVYNRSKSKSAVLEHAGATVAESPAGLMQHADLIFVMITDDQALRAVFKDQNGIFDAQSSGKIIVNMSTVSPVISKEMAIGCRARGNDYLDAPVSGSVKQAESGQLVIMAGGDAKTFEQVKPVLDQLGKLSLLVGETGAGNTAKLAINALLALYTQGLAETVLFAREHGILTEDLLHLISQSAIGSVYNQIKGEAILNENYQAAFALKHLVKDLRLAQEEGISTPLAKTALKSYESAMPTYGEEDIVAIIKAISS